VASDEWRAKRKKRNLHGGRRGHGEEGERIVLGVVEAAVCFADSDAGDFSGFADDWVLWICELGAYVFVEEGSFAFAFAGVHAFDCAGFAAGAAPSGVYFGQDGTEVDDCCFGFAGGWTGIGIWEFCCAGGGGGIWGSAHAGELLVFGGVSCLSGGVVSYAAAGDGSRIYL